VTGKIFINYRRGDDPQAAGRLFDRLQEVFKPEEIFLDIDNIAPGLDFSRVLEERIAECDIFLAIIGKAWLDARDTGGARRLDDPVDFVRIEIEAAFRQNKRVIPVLIGETPMPRLDELPEPLKPLAWRNGVRLTYERFRTDVQGLVKALQEIFASIEDENLRKKAEQEAERQHVEAEKLRLAELELQLLAEAPSQEVAGPITDAAEIGRRQRDDTAGGNMAALIRGEPFVAAILLGTLGVLSGILSALSPWVIISIKIFPNSVLPSPFAGLPDTEAVPLLPGIWFSAVLCAGMILWESKKIIHVTLIFGAVLLGWIVAWEAVCATLDITGIKIFGGVIAGLVGGFCISAVIALGLWICSKDLRAGGSIVAIILTGTALGALYFLTLLPLTGLGPVYILWQSVFAGVVAYYIVAPKAYRMGPQRFDVVSGKGIAALVAGCAVAMWCLNLAVQAQGTLTAREQAQYDEAAGNIDKLEKYANTCQFCAHKAEALAAIADLQQEKQNAALSASRVKAPSPKSTPTMPPQSATTWPPPLLPNSFTQTPSASLPSMPPPTPGTPGSAEKQNASAVSVAALTAARERSLKSGDTFNECDRCPEMIVVPAGSFLMGSPANELGRSANEGPQHKVTIARQFAVGRYALTFEEWDACVADGGCKGYKPDDRWGRGRQPVMNTSWRDAWAYLAWLSAKTGGSYRLLSEAEYEYATRAGSVTAYPWGSDVGSGNANCSGCGSQRSYVAPVGSFPPNKFGLYDMVGNLDEWTDDCYHDNYGGAPVDGSVWGGLDCPHVARGGAWNTGPYTVRSASRFAEDANYRGALGFRVARALLSP